MTWWSKSVNDPQQPGAAVQSKENAVTNKRKPVFVNRTKEYRIFEDAVLTIPRDKTAIRVFHGVGGQGKTALAEHLFTLSNAETDSQLSFLKPAKLLPGAAPEPDRLLVKLRNAFSRSGVPFPAFDFAFAQIWQHTRSDQPMPPIDNPWLIRLDDASDAVAEEFTEITKDALQDILEDIPFFGKLVSKTTRWAVNKVHVARLLNRHGCLAELERSIDLVPDENLIDFLPAIMAHDLREYVAENLNDRLVLFVDEYDRVFAGGGVGPAWSRNQSDAFLREVAVNSGGLLMVFFSRFPLPWDDVEELSDDLSKWQQELDGLSESDADEWLCEEGLMDAEIRARVIKASSEFVHLETGTKCRIYPLVLYLNLQLFQQLVSGGRDLPDDAFAVKAGHRRAHCRKIVERLLGDYSDQTQMLFETLSPLARFDKRTFEFVCREFNIPLGFDAFHRLEDLSIVSNSEDGWLKLHSVIAEIIWEMVQKRRQDGIVERLSAFFANRARPEHPRDVDEEAGICLEEGFRLQLRHEPKDCARWLAESGESVRLAGRHSLLERLWTDCFAGLQKIFGDGAEELVLVSSHLGACLDGQAKFTEAQIHHHRALDIATRKGQSSTAEAAFVKTNMAHGLVEIGTKESLDKARVLQQGALEVYQSDPASDRRETATAHTNLARIAIKLREWDLAEENGRLALELLTRTKGATDAALIVCRSVLGVVLDYRFQEEKVVAFRDEAIALHLSAFQSATELFGTNHQATASTLVHLAEHHSIQGDYFEAEEAFRKAEKSLNETLGELHPKSIRALINRGTNQFFASNTNDAIQIYEVALTHAVQSMGPEHYLVGWVRFKIGTCLLKNGSHDLNDAIGHLQKAESVLAQSFPEDYFLRESCREKLHEAQVLLHN